MRAERLAAAGALLALAIALAGCGASAPQPSLVVPSGAVVVRSQNVRFEPAEVAAVGGDMTLYFDNADSVPHNLVLVAPDGARVFSGDVFTGPGQRTYSLTSVAPGTYQLLCDVHPEMRGSLVVAAP